MTHTIQIAVGPPDRDLPTKLLEEVLGAPPAVRVQWLQRVVCGEPLDRVAAEENTTVFELLQRLSRLEVQGRVVCLGGQRYALA